MPKSKTNGKRTACVTILSPTADRIRLRAQLKGQKIYRFVDDLVPPLNEHELTLAKSLGQKFGK